MRFSFSAVVDSEICLGSSFDLGEIVVALVVVVVVVGSDFFSGNGWTEVSDFFEDFFLVDFLLVFSDLL